MENVVIEETIQKSTIKTTAAKFLSKTSISIKTQHADAD